MRRFFVFLFLFVGFLILFAHDQNKPLTKIKFDKKVYDLGSLKRADAIKLFPVRYKNTGKHNLYLYAVIPECDCTKVKFSQAPLKPGKEGVIYIAIDVRMDAHENFIKYVYVYANTKPDKIEIPITLHIDE